MLTAHRTAAFLTPALAVPHGGGGIVGADGRVGITPRFLALGYSCHRVRNGGVPTSRDDRTNTRHARLSGVDCETTYFVLECPEW